MLGPRFIVSRRFGLVQSDKVRAIDDLSESFVNASYGSSYKLDLPGIDGVSTMARTWLESIGDQCNVCFRLSDGKVLCGKLHDSLLGGKAFCIRGRTLDLDSAYKQILFKSVLVVLRIQQESRSCSYPMFFHVVLQPVCMGSTDWPGPCTPLVEEFLGWFGAITTQLDVYRVYGAERLFHLLGLRVSFKETKRKPASVQFDVLGVTFDFVQASNGNILVKNKASRISQLVSEANGYLHRGEISASEATSLRRGY